MDSYNPANPAYPVGQMLWQLNTEPATHSAAGSGGGHAAIAAFVIVVSVVFVLVLAIYQRLRP